MKTRRQEVKEEHKDDEKYHLKADDASDNDESSTNAGGLTD